MHLQYQRRDVAAQMAEELKTVTYATPPMEKRRRKQNKQKPVGRKQQGDALHTK